MADTDLVGSLMDNNLENIEKATFHSKATCGAPHDAICSGVQMLVEVTKKNQKVNEINSAALLQQAASMQSMDQGLDELRQDVKKLAASSAEGVHAKFKIPFVNMEVSHLNARTALQIIQLVIILSFGTLIFLKLHGNSVKLGNNASGLNQITSAAQNTAAAANKQRNAIDTP